MTLPEHSRFIYRYIYIQIFINMCVGSRFSGLGCAGVPWAVWRDLPCDVAGVMFFFRQLEPRMRLAVRGVPKGALRTHSA